MAARGRTAGLRYGGDEGMGSGTFQDGCDSSGYSGDPHVSLGDTGGLWVHVSQAGALWVLTQQLPRLPPPAYPFLSVSWSAEGKGAGGPP